MIDARSVPESKGNYTILGKFLVTLSGEVLGAKMAKKAVREVWKP